MKNNVTEKSQIWDAHYVGIKATRVRQQNCITLDELALEASRLLFRFVPFTIEEQVPVFMVSAAKPGKNNTKLAKKNY
jgi:hypothetical protein